MAKSLRVGTWNIHEAVPVGQSHSSDGARKEIADLLVRHRLDIVGFQEVDFGASAQSPTLDSVTQHTQLKHIAKNVLSESFSSPVVRSGVALASRFPLTEIRQKRFNNPGLAGAVNGKQMRLFDKGYVSAAVLLDEGPISTVALHSFPFHLFGRDAADPAFGRVWSDLSAALAALASVPLLVCGDFNTSNRDLVSLSGEDSLRGATAGSGTHDQHSYDDILFSSHFEEGPVEIIDNFSDHRLCYIDLALEW
jgi:endonuclease/exonuclease/phosphatase family metal-dependent hydrolase